MAAMTAAQWARVLTAGAQATPPRAQLSEPPGDVLARVLSVVLDAMAREARLIAQETP
jgi:hypothetical protein